MAHQDRLRGASREPGKPAARYDPPLVLQELYWWGMTLFALVAALLVHSRWNAVFWGWFVVSVAVAVGLERVRRERR